MTPIANARKIANYLETLPNLTWPSVRPATTYSHMGATLLMLDCKQDLIIVR